MASKEIKSLTGIRGIASTYIVVFHFFQFYGSTPTGSKSFIVTNSYIASLFVHGYLAVDLFFILSAFVITLSYKSRFEGGFKLKTYTLFMKKRWIRIYPSYFFIALYGYIFSEHGHRTPNFLLSLTLLNLVFGAGHILGHLWSLGAEWITYLLYPLFLKITKYAKNELWNYCLLVAGLTFLYVLSASHAHRITGPFMLEMYQGYPCLFRCFGNYILGIAAFGLFNSGKFKFINGDAGAFIITLLLIISLMFPWADVISVALCVPLIMSIAKQKNFLDWLLGSKVIYFLGVISYPMYLINSLVWYYLPDIRHLDEQYLHTSFPGVFIFLMFLLFSIILSYLFTVIVEMPLIKYFNFRLKNNQFPFKLNLSRQ